ncbi:MAG: hypothetical protein LIP01_09825 [Tannerellaceae bacterium]|nr:hypothetical protein [Tannerellaceae bacterium]
MRKAALFILAIVVTFSCWAQRDNFSYKFYGFVRGDLFYNSRSNVEAIDGIFYLYPENEKLDAGGKDLNAVSNTGFYTLTARLGMDIRGRRVGSAETSAKIEADFGGNASAPYFFRLRHAYVNLNWDNGSSVLVGQTWHPLWSIFPETLNLCTGSPFQPFNRSPQIRYQYNINRFTFTGSAVYQLMSLSPGPVTSNGKTISGKNEDFIKNGIVPELFAGVHYCKNGFLGGVGVEMLSLKPRTESIVNDNIYKVNERITTFSYMAEAQYYTRNWQFAGKTLLASNLSHTNLLGGYGVSAVDERTGKRDYTANQYSTSWLNVVYGDKWKVGAFAGYSKNLGTKDELIAGNPNDPFYYGSGGDIDQLTSGMLHLSYNIPHWKAGVEYNVTTAWYGDTDLASGKVKNTNGVTNHRILFLFTYYF